MNLFQNASHDQIALMGCAAALVFSCGMLYVSAYLSNRRQVDRDEIRRTPQLNTTASTQTQHRKAA